MKKIISAGTAAGIECLNALLGRILPFYLNAKWASKPRVPRHSLPGRLVVSVTSYPLRFPTLPLALKSLLLQSVAADEVILWIGKNDEDKLTSEILALRDDGLTIRLCDDLGPYTKIVPALMSYPDAYIVTADDDVYYRPKWLEDLVAHERGRREVLCHRAHRVRIGANGLPLPYERWEFNTRDREPSALTFPTGHGGVLYPPGALHRDAVNVALFSEFSPRADDLWLYWMMRRNGGVARKIGPRRLLFPTWRGTQRVALWRRNVVEGGNNQCIETMTARFGFPAGSECSVAPRNLDYRGARAHSAEGAPR